MPKRYLTTEQKRSALKLAYADREWVDSVDNMPKKQVYAIYDQLKRDGIINFNDDGSIFFRTREEVRELKKRRREARIGHQMTFDEWAKMQNQMEIDESRRTKNLIRKEFN